MTNGKRKRRNLLRGLLAVLIQTPAFNSQCILQQDYIAVIRVNEINVPRNHKRFFVEFQLTVLIPYKILILLLYVSWLFVDNFSLT